MQTGITLPIRRGQVPPFHELEEYAFQDLSRELYACENSVRECRLYGVRGQRQHGIDFIADRHSLGGIEVAQVKRQKTFQKADIRKASTEFLQYEKEVWGSRGVRRFVLIVSCRVATTQCIDEIYEQKKAFATRGIEYDLWDATKVRDKLRFHRAMVADYLGPAWGEQICGPVSAGSGAVQYPSGPARIVAAELGAQIESLASTLSGAIEQRLEEFRQAWRKGEITKAVEWVQHTKSDSATWTALNDPLKAKILRFEAGLVLSSTQDADRAEKLADEARALHPADDQTRFRAYIAYWRKGQHAALKELGDANTSDDINLRAALLLELGKATEAMKVASSTADASEPDPEGLRVRALAKTALRDLQGAESDIERALSLQPEWIGVKRAYAIILYYSAIYGAASRGTIELWPEPVDWQLIRHDPRTVGRVCNAGQIFESLVEGGAADDRGKENDEIWRLACLAIDPNRQDDAQLYCQKLLTRDPGNFKALSWALTRSYEFNVEKSIRVLSRKAERKRLELGELLGLVACYVFSDRIDPALDLLRRERTRFKDRQERILWQLWRAQTLIRAGQAKRALQLIDRSKYRGELRHARAMALAELAQQSGEWETVADYLHQSYELSGDGRFLLQSSQLRANLGQWELIVHEADDLIFGVGSGEAIRIASVALFNTQRFTQCLDLLNQRVEEFGEPGLPSDLRRLRVACMRVLGDLSDAITQAEILAFEDPSSQNLLDLAQTYFTAGDIPGVVLTAQKLSEKDELTVEDTLRLSLLTKDANPTLSRRLWRKAVQSEVPNSLVGTVVSHGYELGLESEAGSLVRRLFELGESGSEYVKAANLQEVIKFIRGQQRNFLRLMRIYESGSVPIHALVQGDTFSFLNLYHRLLLQNEVHPRPLRQPFVLSRHGARPFPTDRIIGTRNWRLNLDLTAFLMAAHLEILDLVENVFGTLRIPYDLIPALFQMRHRVAAHQPSRTQAIQKVIELIDSGRIRTEKIQDLDGASAFSEEVGPETACFSMLARDRAGYAVCLLPLRNRDLSGPAIHIPRGCKTRIVNCRALLQALKRFSWLSKSEYKKARTALGDEGQKSPRPPINTMGVDLFCCDLTAELLAAANLLELASSRFSLVVSENKAAQLRAELQEFNSRTETAVWLDELIDRCNVRIKSGAYQVLPALSASQTSANRDEDIVRFEWRCLLGLLQIEPTQRDVIWSDDRAINAYSNINGAPIVTILEILRILLDRRKLRKASFYDLLHRLRASNTRFIPVTGEEIALRLKEADVKSGAVVETGQLSTLRRYIAACMVRSDTLQRPPLPDNAPNPKGETAFFLSLIHSAYDALVAIWSDRRSSSALRRTRGEWILDNVFVDVGAARQIMGLVGPGDDPLNLASASLSRLISLAFPIGSLLKRDGRARRQEYLEWLSSYTILPRLQGKPELVRTVSADLKEVIAGFLDDDSDPHNGRVAMMLLLNKFVEDLPQVIRDEICSDAEFMLKLGIRTSQVVGIGDLTFESKAFWDAGARAFGGKRPTLLTVNREKRARISATRSARGARVLKIREIGKPQYKILDEPELILLRGPKSAWERVIRENRQWFDCSNTQLAKLIEEIRRTRSPASRMEFVTRHSENSAQRFYARLLQRLWQGHQFKFDELFPADIQSILRHLRLDGSQSRTSHISEQLKKAVAAVIREEGVAHAIDRFSGLPISLTAPVVKAIKRLDQASCRHLVKRWTKASVSPIARSHLIRVLSELTDESAAYPRLARLSVRKMARSSMDEVRAFRAVLTFTHNQILIRASALNWRPGLILTVTWAHAERIYTALRLADASPEWVERTFRQRQKPIGPELFDRRTYGWDDVLHPQRITTDNLLLGAIAHAIEARPKALIESETVNFLSAHSVFQADGQQMPKVSLMRDPSRARNRLGSFLGSDRARLYKNLLHCDIAKAYGSNALRNLVLNHAQQILDQNEVSLGWSILGAIVGHSSPYPNTITKLKRAVHSTSFIELCREEPQLGVLALHGASTLMIWGQDSKARRHLEEAIYDVAQMLGRQTEPINDGEQAEKEEPSLAESRVQLMFGAALDLAAQRPNETEAAVCFAHLLEAMLPGSEELVGQIKSVALLLSGELPPELARLFAPILVKARAA